MRHVSSNILDFWRYSEIEWTKFFISKDLMYFFFFTESIIKCEKKLSQNLAPKRLGFVRCNLSVVVSGQTWPGSGVMPSPQVPPPTYHAANNTSQHNLCVFCYKSALTWTISQRRRWGRWNSSHPNTFAAAAQWPCCGQKSQKTSSSSSEAPTSRFSHNISAFTEKHDISKIDGRGLSCLNNYCQ